MPLATHVIHWLVKIMLVFFSFFSRLKIYNVSESDDGLYRCRVDFSASQTRTSRVNLTVIGREKNKNSSFRVGRCFWTGRTTCACKRLSCSPNTNLPGKPNYFSSLKNVLGFVSTQLQQGYKNTVALSQGGKHVRFPYLPFLRQKRNNFRAYVGLPLLPRG